MRRVINGFCVALGFVCVGLGCIGIVLPILPTTPFLLLALVLFAKGSERFHRWFMGTRLYRRYLADFVAERSMERATKVKILTVVTLLLGAGIVFSPLFAKVILAAVLAGHYLYFIFGIRTLETRGDREGSVHD